MAEHIITGLEPVKRKKGWFELITKDNPPFYIDEEILYKNELSIGRILSDAGLKQIKENADLAWLKFRSLQIISRRMISERDLKRKLGPERKPSATTDSAMLWLKRFGYIDDHKYAGACIRTQLSRGGKSRLYLKMKLREKGISMDIAEEALDLELKEYDEISVVIELARKKQKTLRNLPALKAKQKLLNFLKGKGFSWEAINKAAAAIKNNRENE